MLLARKSSDSDVFVVATNDGKKFFCIHNDKTRYRMWEPLESMTGNEMYHHLLMHKQVGDKVSQTAIDRCLTTQLIS